MDSAATFLDLRERQEHFVVKILGVDISAGRRGDGGLASVTVNGQCLLC